jgi:hypothetical protein
MRHSTDKDSLTLALVFDTVYINSNFVQIFAPCEFVFCLFHQRRRFDLGLGLRFKNTHSS